MQRKVSRLATTELSNYLGVPVRIGDVNIEWLNRLVLKNVYLEDETGEVLFKANHVSAGFEIIPMMRGKTVFTTVRLFGFSLNLKKQTVDSPLNLQFVIDAFARKDTVKKDKNIDLRIHSIVIRKGNLSFNIESEKTTPGKFNAKHIDLQDISANISLKAFHKDSVNAQIKKMSFKEASGFFLDKLSLIVIGNRDSASIQDFKIDLPQTDLNINLAQINLTKVDSLPNLLDDAPIKLTISPSKIYPRDLSAFIPAFKNFTDAIELSAEANGYINDFNLERLTLKYSDKMLFIGQMGLKDIAHPQQTYLLGKVNKMYITTEGLNSLANNFNNHPVIFPDPLIRLGTINFTGEISGFFNNLTAFGKLSSSIGSIQTDMIFGQDKGNGIAAYLQGRITSGQLRLSNIFDKSTNLGDARFDIEINAQRPINGSFYGNIKAQIQELEYKSYTYKDILLSGDFQKNGFNGLLQVNDPNGHLYAQGLFQRQEKDSFFDFTSQLDHFRPDKLNLTDKYDSPDISLSLSADFRGDNIDNVEGNIHVDHLSFKTIPNEFYLDKLEITASGNNLDRQVVITSDILNGEVTGTYSFHTLIPSWMNTIKEYVPALIHTKQKEQGKEENNLALLLTLENTEALSNTLKLPFTILQSSRITGHYNTIYNKFRLEAWIPQLKLGNTWLESGYLVCENPNDRVNLQLKATQYNQKGLRNYLDLKAEAKDNLVNAVIGWANNKERLFKADLSASTHFIEEENEHGSSQLRTEVTLDKSELIINDTLWTINPAQVTICDKKIDIHHFKIDREQQFLTIDGTVSNDPTDSLLVNLKEIELSYVFDVLNIPVLQFAGKATGQFYFNDLFKTRMLNTDLKVQNFSFNQVTLGELKLFSEWDNEQQGILMRGTIYKNDSTWTGVNGYIFPVGTNAGLSLYFDANDIDLMILQPFVEKVVKDLRGKGTGNIHLYGSFKAVNVEGDAYIKDGGVGIDFLNTYYTFSDPIHLDSTSVNLRGITVKDKLGNTGNLDLKFNHRHFHDYNFQVNFQGNNMLVYNADQKKNPLIYGTVFASGTAQIKGNNKLINFDINMQNEANTSIYLDFMTNNTATDYDFITYIDKDKLLITQDSTTTSTPSINADKTKEGAEMQINLLLDLTPDATIELIMDPIAGDKIKGTASGNLQISYGNRSDLRMYGDMNIVEGNYNFSLQQIIHKDFQIREGSTVNFRGDPFNANMNINAIYNLTANIGDLDESLLNESSRTNVPVNCVLNLNGSLRQPTFSFDLEFPNSNEELERQVKAFLDTEDMMTRQIIYLLVLNKFYTPEYATTSYQSSELNAVASSAISAQLSSLLNSITDKVQIGTNIRAGQDGFTDNTEYEMLLSSQLLDNRLLINGNFGMRNTINTGNTNTFIGEFDLEYKLTKSGDIRLKAYNHARDTYYGLKQALTIQGVGVSFQKDFTHFSEIFKKKRNAISNSTTAPQDTTTLIPTAIQDSTTLSIDEEWEGLIFKDSKNSSSSEL